MSVSVAWMAIPELEGYEISSTGELRSLPRCIVRSDGQVQRIRGGPLKLLSNQDGYLYACIHRKRYYVHILMCQIVHGPRPTPLHQVRHLNGINTDNLASNLAWGTPSENALDSVRHGTHAMAAKTHCPAGHEYTLENTYRDPKKNGRNCIKCQRERNRKWMRGYSARKKVAQ